MSRARICLVLPLPQGLVIVRSGRDVVIVLCSWFILSIKD
jgi:hypothetical protein